VLLQLVQHLVDQLQQSVDAISTICSFAWGNKTSLLTMKLSKSWITQMVLLLIFIDIRPSMILP
jgi:hypothetical protein